MRREKGGLYSPYFNQNTPKEKPRSPTYDLDNQSNYPSIIWVKTEKQLCYFLYKTFGPGIYRILGHLKGRQGSWTFWKGEVTDEGFCFSLRERSNSALARLSKELKEAQTDEEKQEIQNDIDDEKEFNSIDKPIKYGYKPYLTPSSYRGEFITWDEPDDHYFKEEKGDKESKVEAEW